MQERMQQEACTDENGNRRPITDEIYRKVMPLERHGRVSASSSMRIQGLEQQLTEMTIEVASLKRKLQENEEEMEGRIKEREDEMERRMMLEII
ncbi:hypothetical protein BVC80_1053g7 [Macleaya cordata]|uniref:Uncharacterized protein n=1 Tax=Macleaya cordata TaxID=56857 RepID=A0A200R808_MACCD|nr:hypothetical protein BVC80_1053g7 [Macleaya cordata]